MPHTLLIHYNPLNSLFLADVLDAFRQRGWRIIDAEEAYPDPIFQRTPKTLPAGESLLWALAKETGKAFKPPPRPLPSHLPHPA